MNKKGVMRTEVIRAIRAAIVLVLVVSFLAVILGGRFIDIAKLVPGFGQEDKKTEDLSLVGLNLKDGSLRYHTGKDWAIIKRVNVPSFPLDKREFVPVEVWRAFINFYFETERKPRELFLDVSDLKRWAVRSGAASSGLVEIQEKRGYFNPFDFERPFSYNWLTIFVEPKSVKIAEEADFYFLVEYISFHQYVREQNVSPQLHANLTRVNDECFRCH